MGVELVILTGLSGAGRTRALDVFEDEGWFCVDNLPPRMLAPMADLFSVEGSDVGRACVVCDARGGEYFAELRDRIADLRERGMPVRVVFLDADDDVLIRRYKETRRRHPLGRGRSVARSVALERERLAALRAEADVVVDTSRLNVHELRTQVLDAVLRTTARRMQVTITSFGFKYGTPQDADLLLDLRFLPNPHWIGELQALSGLDEAVRAYLAESAPMGPFWERLTALGDLLLPAYEAEGKAHLVAALGCTGGRHRSVYVATEVGDRYRDRGFDVSVVHRDLDKDTRP